MTNRQWLIWQLIDVPDDVLADMLCESGRIWSCDDCMKLEVSKYSRGCKKRLYEWLKQEHVESGADNVRR